MNKYLFFSLTLSLAFLTTRPVTLSAYQAHSKKSITKKESILKRSTQQKVIIGGTFILTILIGGSITVNHFFLSREAGSTYHKPTDTDTPYPNKTPIIPNNKNSSPSETQTTIPQYHNTQKKKKARKGSVSLAPHLESIAEHPDEDLYSGPKEISFKPKKKKKFIYTSNNHNPIVSNTGNTQKEEVIEVTSSSEQDQASEKEEEVVKEPSNFEDWALSLVKQDEIVRKFTISSKKDQASKKEEATVEEIENIVRSSNNKVALSNIDRDESILCEKYMYYDSNKKLKELEITGIHSIALQALDPSTGQIAIVTTSLGKEKKEESNNTIWIVNFNEKRLEQAFFLSEGIKKITYAPNGYTLIVATKSEIFSISTEKISEVKKTTYVKEEDTEDNEFLDVLGCDGQYIYYGKTTKSSSGKEKVLYTVSMSDNKVETIPLPQPIEEKIKLKTSDQYLSSLEPQISSDGSYIAWLETNVEKDQKPLLCIMSKENGWALVKNDFSETVPEGHIIRHVEGKEYFKFHLNPDDPNDVSLIIQQTHEDKDYTDFIYLISFVDKNNPQTKIVSLNNDGIQGKYTLFPSNNRKDLIYVDTNNDSDYSIIQSTLRGSKAIKIKKELSETQKNIELSAILPVHKDKEIKPPLKNKIDINITSQEKETLPARRLDSNRTGLMLQQLGNKKSMGVGDPSTTSSKEDVEEKGEPILDEWFLEIQKGNS